MRTTLNLDDDVLKAARSLASSRSISLGDAVSDLVRRGLSQRPVNVTESGVPVFYVRPGARPLTLEDVKAALEDEV